MIRTDNGPEVTGNLVDDVDEPEGGRAAADRARQAESERLCRELQRQAANGRLRDECLIEHWFRSLTEAREITGAWRANYNQRRPHSALGYRTPAEFAPAWRARHAGHARQEAHT